jgi:hypothetical protein
MASFFLNFVETFNNLISGFLILAIKTPDVGPGNLSSSKYPESFF